MSSEKERIFTIDQLFAPLSNILVQICLSPLLLFFRRLFVVLYLCFGESESGCCSLSDVFPRQLVSLSTRVIFVNRWTTTSAWQRFYMPLSSLTFQNLRFISDHVWKGMILKFPLVKMFFFPEEWKGFDFLIFWVCWDNNVLRKYWQGGEDQVRESGVKSFERISECKIFQAEL